MIEKQSYLIPDFGKQPSKELRLLSIVSQSFFQPFSLEDNLLVILTALTAGSGVGFNRAMLMLVEGDKLRGEVWLGPSSVEEANSIWEILSTPGIGYAQIIEHNRSLLSRIADDSLSNRIKTLSYSLAEENPSIPALAASKKEIIAVKDAWNEPLVDKNFKDIIGVDSFLCIPLIARDEVLGEIVVDNGITHEPIGARDIELANICGLMAGNFIHTARLHKKMVEMQKLAAVGEMAMFITHQLRTPLVTIGGFTDQLLSSQVDKEKRKRNLRIIRNEIKRLEDILLKLTKFLKIEIKELAPFDVQSILNSVLGDFETKLRSQGVTLNVQIEKGIPRFLCEPTYVGEALRNVLDNALDAVSQGGEISIHVYGENEEWLVISIKDTGKGIPESIKGKIFHSFFSTKEKGMGLGLSYVKRVIGACGGKIEVESEEDKGTVFKLYFKTSERG